MKKLLTFAGVSALALVTAAPNAFGASYGIYNPSCGTNAVTVKFWGYNTSGVFTELQTLTFQGGSWKNDGNAITTLTPSLFPDVTNVKVGNNTYAKLIPMQFQSVMGEPDASPVNTSSTCEADTAKARYAIGGSLPTEIFVKNGNEVESLGNRTEWNYVISYAADCQPGDNATCTLTVDKSKGQAVYSNACDTGHGNPNWSTTTALSCMTGVYVETENPNPPAVY